MTGRQEPQLWNNLGLTFTRRLFASVLCRSSFAPGRNATSSLAFVAPVAGPGLASKWRYSQESTPPRVADEEPRGSHQQGDLPSPFNNSKSSGALSTSPGKSQSCPRYRSTGSATRNARRVDCRFRLDFRPPRPLHQRAYLAPRKRKNGPSSSTAPSVACQLYRLSKVDVPPCHGYSATPTRILCVIIAVAPATLR